MTFGKILPYLLKGERVWLRGMPPFNTCSEVCEFIRLTASGDALELVSEIKFKEKPVEYPRPLPWSRNLLERDDWELVDSKEKEK